MRVNRAIAVVFFVCWSVHCGSRNRGASEDPRPPSQSGPPAAVEGAAGRYEPSVTWRPASVVGGDLNCDERQDHAILGTSHADIVVAVFLAGTNQRPEVLRYSSGVRDPASVVLMIEDLDHDTKTDGGSGLPGFRRSKTCKGLNLSDGKMDAAHIYWNHDDKRFSDWVR